MGMTSARQRDLYPLVALAFAADFQHADGADLGDVAHVRASARLQVDARDSQQPYSPAAPRRLHAHRLDELGPGVELLFGDPNGFGGGTAGDERVGLALDRLRVEQAHVD